MRKKIYIDCASVEPVGGTSSDMTAVDGADTTTSRFQAGPYSMEIYNTGANSDVLPTRVLDGNSVNGWQLANDNTDGDGGEMGFGVLANSSAQHCFKIGTDPAFEFEVKIGIPAVADYDVLGIGFRTATGDYTDDINSNTELYAAYSEATEHAFGINIDNADYKVFKTTNGADAQDDVAVTNASNDDTPVLTVRVSAAGAVSALVDGVACTLTNAGTAFDTGDIVVPYIFYCKDATAAADTPPILQYIKCGYQD